MLNVLFYAAAAVYPLAMFCCLVVFKLPLRFVSLFIVFIALAGFLLATSKKKSPASRLPRLFCWRGRVSYASYPIRLFF